VLNFLKSMVTWWNGATLGVRFHVGRRGVFIGQDEHGNRYFEARDNSDSYDARKRRWVIYRGYAEASKVSPDWHGWLHYTFDEPPTVAPFRTMAWEKGHLPNLTGTIHAYKPQGALSRGGERQKATGDYEAWTPK
jgi:NADH:ubiquinone oxidoreductase subunit